MRWTGFYYLVVGALSSAWCLTTGWQLGPQFSVRLFVAHVNARATDKACPGVSENTYATATRGRAVRYLERFKARRRPTHVRATALPLKAGLRAFISRQNVTPLGYVR